MRASVRATLESRNVQKLLGGNKKDVKGEGKTDVAVISFFLPQ
jgi:hypothetical protein